MKYKTKPKKIEAFQYNGGMVHIGTPEWVVAAYMKHYVNQ